VPLITGKLLVQKETESALRNKYGQFGLPVERETKETVLGFAREQLYRHIKPVKQAYQTESHHSRAFWKRRNQGLGPAASMCLHS
jgi:hypothetical protein